jgi:outer membrane protein TolC
MIGLSASGENYPGAGLGEDPMAMTALEFTQAIPWPGKRSRREAVAAARVPGMQAARDGARRAVAADVREAWAGLYASGQAVAALRQTLALLDVLEPQALARYETGTGAQTDWLALRRERIMLASAIERELADRTGILARLAVALDDTAARAAIEADALPDEPDSTVAPVTGATFADVAMAEAGVDTARRMHDAAKLEGRPDLVLGAEYGWRDELAPMITARVGVELPLWRGRKQDAMARAAAHGEVGALAAARDARLQADAEVRTLRVQHEAAARAANRLRSQILPLLDLTAGSARARYLAGDASADLLIEALRDRAEARADLAREEAARFAAGSRLRAMAGMDPVVRVEPVAGNGREP